MAQQILNNGETYGSHRNKVNANETELYAAVASAQAVANAAIPTTQKAAANGVASLDGTGKVPSGQLPAAAAFTLASATDVASFDLGTTNTSVAAIKATANAAATASALATTNATVATKQSVAQNWSGTTPALASGVNPVTAGFGGNAFVYTGAGGAVLDGNTFQTGDLAVFVGSAWTKTVLGGGYLGAYANSAALQTAYPAASNPACIGLVGASAPYAIYFSNGNVWIRSVVASTDLTDSASLVRMLGTFTSTSALQTAFPAASNAGNEALVGSSAPYVKYCSNGSVWALQDGTTFSSQIAANTAALSVQTDNAQTGTTYTLVLADAGQNVDMNNASANTLTIPPNSSVAFPIGTLITVTMVGAGVTTIAAGAGVTVVKPSARSLSISAQYETAQLYKTATDTWRVLAG